MDGPAGQSDFLQYFFLSGFYQLLLSAGQIWTNLFFMLGFFCERKLWLGRGAHKWEGRAPVGASRGTQSQSNTILRAQRTIRSLPRLVGW
jgi:hypothetical protein